MNQEKAREQASEEMYRYEFNESNHEMFSAFDFAYYADKTGLTVQQLAELSNSMNPTLKTLILAGEPIDDLIAQGL